MRPIDLIVIHCSATPDGVSLARFSPGAGIVLTAAQTIDGWHKERGFARDAAAVAQFNAHLPHIGYHYVIDVDGRVETGRELAEIGAHARGFNARSVAICMVGRERYSRAQWEVLRLLLCGADGPGSVLGAGLARSLNVPLRVPERAWLSGGARVSVRNGVCGHRDLAPDQDRNGIVERWEWLKTCPGFDVAAWLRGNCRPPAAHLLDAGVDDFLRDAVDPSVLQAANA